MLTEITPIEVENIIRDYLDLNLRLKNLKFYKSEIEADIIISSTNTGTSLQQFQIFQKLESMGTPIIQIKKGNFSLLPPIINSISDEYKSYLLENKLLTSISYGKTIQLKKQNSFCFISNDLGDKISFGKIENNMYTPFVDLGWYLRQGT